MCKELYQRWNGCDCWGFLRCDPCPRLFKGCMGPGGDEDKHVVEWNDGMCNECWERLLIEAREEAEAAKERETNTNTTQAQSYHARKAAKRRREAVEAEELAAASASSASDRSHYSRSECTSTPGSTEAGFWY
ncbi:uncharacterized protein PG998_013447 [Apiospora kogelbergensis]|uniref:Uncharacterized protein n=1 Tax=Apiospora kogelbergensis TaxID=1337665 RepID=A0AAW0R1F1_9PEZI